MIIKDLKFEVYLEGIKIPGVLGISISEVMNNPTQAGITVSGSSNTLKVLAGTLVQIFGYKGSNFVLDSSKDAPMYLLYEGKISKTSYNKSGTGEIFTLNCIGLTSEFYTTRLRPADSVITRSKTKQTGIKNSAFVMTGSSEVKGAETKDAANTEKERIFKTIREESGLTVILEDLNFEFTQILGKGTPGELGNFKPFFNKLQEFFIKSDVLYGINAKSLNLFNSVFVAPNPELNPFFQTKVMMEAINSKLVGSFSSMAHDTTLSLQTFFNAFKENLKYTSITPASPTQTVKEFAPGKNADMETNFLREYYIPHIESGPPILSNIILPKDILNFQFSNDLLSEITRTIVTGTMSISGVTSINSFAPTAIAPADIALKEYTSGDASLIVTNFSEEEYIRGVNIKESQVDLAYNSILLQHYKDETKGNPTDENVKALTDKEYKKSQAEPIEENIYTELQTTATMAYLNGKFAPRSIQATVAWNPNFVVGLPGMLFNENMPTFIGVVTSVSHSMSASGSTITTVNLSNCRILYDEGTEYDELLGAPTRPEEQIYNPLKDHVLDSISEAPILGGVGYLHNSNLYSFENIGLFLYSFLTTGKYNHERFSESLPTGTDWEKWKDYYFPIIEFEKVKDYSILRYIRNEEGNLDPIIDSKEKEIPAGPQLNGYNLLKSIRAFKQLYYIKEKQNIGVSSILEYWAAEETNRNIITKTDYLGSIGGNNDTVNGYLLDTKDLKNLVDVTLDGNLQRIKEDLLDLGIPVPSTVVLSQTNNSIKKLTIDLEKQLKLEKELKKEALELRTKHNDLRRVARLFRERVPGKSDNQKTNEQKAIVNKDEIKTLKEKIKTKEELVSSLTAYLNKITNVVLKEDLAVVERLLFPYNATRKGHVYEAFGNYKLAMDITIKE